MKRLRVDEDEDEYDDYDFDAVEEEAEENVGVVKTGSVDARGIIRGLYLMKLPTIFLKALEGGAQAKLRLPTASDAATGRAVGELLLEDAKGNQPSKYEVQIKPESSKIMVFSTQTSDEEGKVAVEGTVSHQCITTPVLDAKFRNLIRRQAKLASQPKQSTVTLDDEEVRQAEYRVVKVETAQQKEERKFQNQQKRRHTDLPDEQWRSETMTRVFELFNARPHWSLAEVSTELDEPQQRLKTLLAEACLYNKGGPHRNMYELKDEYKTKVQREQKSEELQARREARKAEQERMAKAREERDARERDR